jgi:hypothetical protein
LSPFGGPLSGIGAVVTGLSGFLALSMRNLGRGIGIGTGVLGTIIAVKSWRDLLIVLFGNSV